MSFEIRPATLDDRGALVPFLRAAYGAASRYKYPQRWSWQYLDNPFRSPGRIPVWLALDSGRIIGQMGETHAPMVFEGQELQAVSQGDLVVLPEYRQRGVARALLAASQAQHELVLDLWMSPISEHVLAGLGFEPLPAVRLYDYCPAMLGVPAAPARRVAEVEIRPVERFGPEVDVLWGQLANEFSIGVCRRAAYLNWKYVAQPYVQYQLWEASSRGALTGYLILRRGVPPEPPLGVVSDLFAAPRDSATLAALCQFAISHFANSCAAIVGATTVPEYCQAYEWSGFRLRPARQARVIPYLWCHRSRMPPLGNSARAGTLIGRSDSDWDQYPHIY